MRIQSVFLCLLVLVSIAGQLPAEDQVFFGNLHSHTSYSDGSGKPSEAFRHARYSAHLDFLAITEHNHSGAEFFADADRKDGVLIATNTGLYTGPDPESLIPQANECTVDGKFVAIYGQEYSGIGSGNHVNVFDVPKVIDVRNGEFSKLLDWLAANKDSSGKLGLLQFNHPALHDDESDEYGADDFSSRTEWRNKMDAVSQLIEIANGPAMTTGCENASLLATTCASDIARFVINEERKVIHLMAIKQTGLPLVPIAVPA